MVKKTNVLSEHVGTPMYFMYSKKKKKIKSSHLNLKAFTTLYIQVGRKYINILSSTR